MKKEGSESILPPTTFHTFRFTRLVSFSEPFAALLLPRTLLLASHFLCFAS